MADQGLESPQTPGRSQSSPIREGRILDRKIESRGLPHSFSSNLARKRPSPNKIAPSSGKSVRAIVNWLEKGPSSSPEGLQVPTARRNVSAASTATGASSTGATDGTNASNIHLPTWQRKVSAASAATRASSTGATDGTNASSLQVPTEHRNVSAASNATGTSSTGATEGTNTSITADYGDCVRNQYAATFQRGVRPVHITRPIVLLDRGEYQVEDYSLTLLRYKAYFNERPLGRCLDHLEKQETGVKEGSAATATEDATQKASAKRLSRSDTLREISTPSSIERLEMLMEELQELDLSDEDEAPEAEAPSPPTIGHCNKRGSTTAKAF